MKRKRTRSLSVAASGSVELASAVTFAGAVDAMSVALPDTPDHPNKLPFTGILTRVDQVSDMAPNGTGGKKIIVPADVAQNALASLLGMGVDYTDKFDGHDVTKKIGVITSAELDGDAVRIGGIFYAADFPAETALLRQRKDEMGFSFEAKHVLVRDPDEDPLVFTSMVFTGAAVLRKNKAAYHSTALAASADGAAGELLDMDAKQILDAVAALQASVDTRFTAIDGRIAEVAAAAAAAKPADVSAQVASLRKTAGELTTAGIDASALVAQAAALEAGRTLTVAVSASAAAQPDVAKLVADAVASAFGPLKDSVAALGTKVTDLAAKPAAAGAAVDAGAASAPARKTLDVHTSAALTRLNFSLPADGKVDAGALQKVMTDAGLEPTQRIAIKNGLERAGRL